MPGHMSLVLRREELGMGIEWTYLGSRAEELVSVEAVKKACRNCPSVSHHWQPSCSHTAKRAHTEISNARASLQ